jgi:hypothetical protein
MLKMQRKVTPRRSTPGPVTTAKVTRCEREACVIYFVGDYFCY